MMKSIFLFAFFCLSMNSYSQGDIDNFKEVRVFHSLLIDYEVYNANIVAITKKQKNHYIHFTNSNNEEVSEILDVLHPSEIEIDAKGDLYIIGLDEAIQIELSDKVEIVKTLDLETYQSNKKELVAYFEQSDVRMISETELLFEPNGGNLHTMTFDPVMINFQSMDAPPPGEEAKEVSSSKSENAGYSQPYPPGNLSSQKNEMVINTKVPDQLSIFKSNDSLWVFNLSAMTLFICGPEGDIATINSINPKYLNFEVEQDKSTGKIYIKSYYSRLSAYVIEEIDRLGNTIEATSINKTSFISFPKIANGSVYIQETSFTTSRIKSIKLN